jgi:serine/threonine-protein kinase RsbW
MTGNVNKPAAEALILQGRISELAQLHSWIERWASQFAIPQDTQFAMNLCLEEVLSNIIRHGYSGDSDHRIAVHFDFQKGVRFTFIVDDQAPLFNPLEAPELPSIDLQNDVQLGGQGIRLLREFADTLEYRATLAGNRLTIGFSAPNPMIAPGCNGCSASSENVL